MTGHRATRMPPPRDVQHHSAAQLFRAHAKFIANFLHRLGTPLRELDDLVQEVFLVAHRRGGFIQDGRAKPTTWLAEVALRVASTHRRKNRRRHETPDQAKISLAATSAHCPAQSAENRESNTHIHAALEQLDEEKRAIFLLFELEGESCLAIAEVFQIPVGTVYSRLHSARKLFKDAYLQLSSPPQALPKDCHGNHRTP